MMVVVVVEGKQMKCHNGDSGNAKISAVRSLADICFLHVLIRLIRCLFVCLFFLFMLKLLQYCNYIIIVMQIKLMLLLLLRCIIVSFCASVFKWC